MRTILLGLMLLILLVTNAQDDAIVHLPVTNALQVAWNHDQSRLALLNGEQIFVWDTQAWVLVNTISDAYVYGIDWHPSENVIAGVRGGGQEALVIWDGDTGELQHQFVRQIPDIFVGTVVLHTVSWSPDGMYVASDSVLDTVVIWDVTTGTYETPIPNDDNPNITELLWSDKYLLAGTTDGTIWLWDAESGEAHLRVDGYKHVAWSAEGQFFAGAGSETAVNIWDVQSAEIQITFNEHDATITSVDWNNDILASTDANGTLYLWEAGTGDIIPLETPIDAFITGAVWRPDGQQLAIMTRHSVRVVAW